MKKICLDLTNIVPGVGGSGGGIATYGKSLVLGLDAIFGKHPELAKNYSLTVLLNERTYENLVFKNIEASFFKVNNQSLLDRMSWLHHRLPKYLKENQVDLVHRVVSELPFRKVSKTLVNVHDFMFDFYLKDPRFGKYLKFKEKIKFKILNYFVYKSIKDSDAVLVNTQAVKNEALSKLSVNPHKIKAVHLAYDKKTPNQSKVTKETEVKNDKINFGVVAAFHPHKGHLDVIRLAKKMLALGYGDRIHFYFRGSPVYQNYYTEVKDLIVDLGLREYFTFEAYDPNVTLEEIYQKYTATILLSDCEGFGLPVIETQAFQKPVICSDIPVFREILGDSAIFLSHRPSDQAVNELIQNLSDEQFLAEMISKGNTNSDKYSWAKTCREVFEVYQEVLAQK